MPGEVGAMRQLADVRQFIILPATIPHHRAGNDVTGMVEAVSCEEGRTFRIFKDDMYHFVAENIVCFRFPKHLKPVGIKQNLASVG